MARMVKQHTIVNVNDFFEDNNTAYIVMEYIDGLTLSEMCKNRNKCFAVKEALDIVEPVFWALSDLHEAGMIHRDISPDNIMLENGVVQLLDLGCARDTVNGMTPGTMTVVLKHGYAPQEQYASRGQGSWTDVYSLGATVYFLITGIVPPHAYDRIENDELTPPSKLGINITESQESAIMKALSLMPRDRYSSIKEFHDDLYKNHGNDFKETWSDDVKWEGNVTKLNRIFV